MDEKMKEKLGDLLVALLGAQTGYDIHRLDAAWEPGDFIRLCPIKDKDAIRAKMEKNINDAVKSCLKDNHPLEDTLMVWPKKYHDIAETLPVSFSKEQKVPNIAGIEAECWQLLATQ